MYLRKQIYYSPLDDGGYTSSLGDGAKISFFSTQPYDKQFFNRYNNSFGFDLEYFETQLNNQTVSLVNNAVAVCVFVNARADASVIQQLSEKGVRIIALRCAGFNN